MSKAPDEVPVHDYKWTDDGFGQDPWGLWVVRGNEDGHAYGTLAEARRNETPQCCGVVMRDCSVGDPDWHCDTCGKVTPWPKEA